MQRRIVIVSHYYPPHLGGIELVARNHAQRLHKLGHDVTVVTSKVNAQETSGDDNGVNVIRVRALNPLEKRGVPQPLFSPRLLWVMARAVKNADVVHVHDVFYMSSLTAGIFAWLYKKPLVLTQHIVFVRHQSALVNAAQKMAHAVSGTFLFRTARVIFTLNDDVNRFLLAKGVAKQKIQHAPNGVDTKLFFPATAVQKKAARKNFGLPQDKPIVLFVGRFVPKKGFDKVIAAHSADYQLVLAGGTVDKPLPAGVTVLGKLPQEKLAELYRAADIFVLPSYGEGFPLSVQEAMASGLPVITTDDPGYASYRLDKKMVRLVPNPTAKTVRTAIADLVKDAPLRKKMGAYSADYAAHHFTWEQIIATLDSTYGTLGTGK